MLAWPPLRGWTGRPVRSVDEAALERYLLVAPERPRDHVQPDYGRLHQELRRKGMTLMLLWEEHRADHADRQTYGYTQFCENYRRFARQLKRSMRQVHRAGEKLFIDYAGPTIGLTDGSRAHIFVAALGASSYIYACATPSPSPRKKTKATMASADSPLRFPPSPLQTRGEISPGKNALLHRTTAGFTPLRLDHKSFAVSCPLALLGSTFYPVLVHRLAVSLHASSPQSVALPQLRCASFAVLSSRRDLHPQEYAHAGRT
jgi:hypothetical protein